MDTKNKKQAEKITQTKDWARLERVCDDFINMVMDFYDIPGIAVGVYAGKPEGNSGDGTPYLFTGAGGYRNYETKELMKPDTVFHCTSVSKLFTAMGIMKLVESGKLALSDRLCDVVPSMSIADKRWENITIESMLTHTSGLTDVSDYGWGKHRSDVDALKEYALSDEVAGRKLLWEPAVSTDSSDGAHAGKFRYSSMAYDLLGLVIAEVSELTFEDYMKQEIFEPQGMDDTTFDTYDRIKDSDEFLKAADRIGLAMPHIKGRDRVMHVGEVYPYTRQHAPSSTLTSTAGDLLKWAGGLLEREPQGAPLHMDSLQDMWAPRAEVPDTGEQMGLGWFIREQNVSVDRDDMTGIDTYTLVGHEGSDDGFRTSFWMCPELGIATVLLCNLTDAPLKKLNKKLFHSIYTLNNKW